MSKTTFPKLAGLTWDVKKTPEFFNLIQPSTYPGYETRISLGPDPLYHFECDYSVLRESIQGATYNELRVLESFFNSMNGDFDSFLLYLPDLTQRAADGNAVSVTMTIDGSNYAPVLINQDTHTTNYNETIYELGGVNGNPNTAPVLMHGSTTLVSGVDYTWVPEGASTVTTTYPGIVAHFTNLTSTNVTATFTWFYRVRFEQPKQEFNVFSYLLWEAKQVQLMQTRTE